MTLLISLVAVVVLDPDFFSFVLSFIDQFSPFLVFAAFSTA